MSGNIRGNVILTYSKNAGIPFYSDCYALIDEILTQAGLFTKMRCRQKHRKLQAHYSFMEGRDEMTENQNHQNEDEIFFDHLKDQFVFFYALTIAGMEAFKQARGAYLKKTHKSGQ